jgi:hypothetical protein
MRLIIVSGLSGSGKSVALNMLEDLGWYCIDNIPAGLVQALVSHSLRSDEPIYRRLAVGLDARNRPDDLASIPALAAGSTSALAAAGVKSSTRLDGVSLLPFLTGQTAEPPHAALFWRYGEQMAVRAGDWKLTRAIDQTATPPALKTGLFNLREDVSEQNDLSGNEPAKAKELQTLWDQWNAHNVKALWGGEARGGEDRKADAPSAKKEEAGAPA